MPELPVLNTVYRCFQPGRARLDVELVVDIATVLLGDSAAAERWRQACWVVAGLGTAAAIVSVADVWPDDLPSFTGRHNDLARIVEPVNGQRFRTSVWAIAGMPGVGKTRFAVRAGHLFMARGLTTDLRLAVDLRGYDPDRPPADPGAVLEGFLRRLGLSGDQIQHLGVDERAARYRHLLARRTALILLDNAASAEQVRPLLPDAPGCYVLITSRRTLDELPSVRQVPLDVLDPDDSVELPRRAADGDQVDAEPDTATHIAGLLGHLPLALALAAGRIRATPDWTLADHLERLEHHRRGLRLENGVEVAISLSYRDLPSDRQRAFRLLALHPGNDITVPAAAALTGGDPTATGQHLEQLIAGSLLQRPMPLG